MNNCAIQTSGLSRVFGNVHALEGLNLEIPPGIVFGFLGPNGAGKTTTIRLLLGLLEPTQGSAVVLGFDTRTQADAIRQRCGALLEYNGLYDRLSAEDNLMFYGRVWHMPAPQLRARIQEILTHMGLWERRKDLVRDWSRGMKQKLALARSLLHKPELVFLDEPTAGLDPIAALAVREDMASLAKREGVTIFLTTHNLAEAEKLCQQVGIINQGKLLAVGTLDELRGRNGSPKVEIVGKDFNDTLLARLQAYPGVSQVHRENNHLSIDLSQGMDTAPLISLIISHGGQVEEVNKSRASLEDVFMTLIQEEKEGVA